MAPSTFTTNGRKKKKTTDAGSSLTKLFHIRLHLITLPLDFDIPPQIFVGDKNSVL